MEPLIHLHVLVTTALARLRLLHGDERGQAMVEYSTITFAILIGSGVFAFAVPFGGDPSLVAALYHALQIYVNSFYYCLSLSFS